MDDVCATQVLKLAQLGREGLRVYPRGWDESWFVTVFVERIEEDTEFAIWAINPEIDPYKHRIIGGRSSLADCIGPCMRKLAGAPGIGADFEIPDAQVNLLERIAAAHQPATYAEAVAVICRQ